MKFLTVGLFLCEFSPEQKEHLGSFFDSIFEFNMEGLTADQLSDIETESFHRAIVSFAQLLLHEEEVVGGRQLDASRRARAKNDLDLIDGLPLEVKSRMQDVGMQQAQVHVGGVQFDVVLQENADELEAQLLEDSGLQTSLLDATVGEKSLQQRHDRGEAGFLRVDREEAVELELELVAVAGLVRALDEDDQAVEVLRDVDSQARAGPVHREKAETPPLFIEVHYEERQQDDRADEDHDELAAAVDARVPQQRQANQGKKQRERVQEGVLQAEVEVQGGRLKVKIEHQEAVQD